MIVYPSTPGGFAIFCDDIREETGGKQSFMGTYNGNMLIALPFPLTMPQICCFAQVLLDPDALPERVSIELQKHTDRGDVEILAGAELPPLSEMPPVEFSPSFGEHKQLIYAALSMRVGPFEVDVPMTLRAVAIVDGKQYRLGNLTVTQVDRLPQQH